MPGETRADGRAGSLDVPIACSLEAGAVPGRVDEWRALLDRVVDRTVTPDGGIRVVFAADVSPTEVVRLAAAEQHCCPFFAFSITLDQRGAALEVRVPESARAFADSLFG